MNRYASIIPPETPVPEPPEMKAVSIAIAVLCSLALCGIIAFIAVDFTMEMAGEPLRLDEADSPEPGMENVAPREAGTTRPDPNDVVAQYELLSPRNRSRIPGDIVAVLATWKPGADARMGTPPLPLRLFVDDFPIPWDIQLGSNTWFARLKMKPGLHRLRTSVFDAEFFVEGDISVDDEPAGRWPPLKMHPDVDDLNACGDCHHWVNKSEDLIRKGRGLTLGPWKGASSCFSCHASMECGMEFENRHGHPAAPWEDCRQCHILHGTTSRENALLRTAPGNFCAECHEPPESPGDPADSPLTNSAPPPLPNARKAGRSSPVPP